MAKKVETGSGVWRLLINPPLNGYLNMALDELLLEEAKRGVRPPTLRFYQWKGDWISYGYFQPPRRAFNVEAAREAAVSAVRRITGGRAVLHSEDLTYSLAAGDAQKEGLGSSLKETYRQIARALTSGFTRLGLPVAFSLREKRAAPSPFAGPAACFLTLSDYEISSGGKKLVGSAQRREGSAFLQHGSIPLTRRNRELAERVLARSTGATSPGNGVSTFHSRYTTVEEAAGREVSIEALTAALREGFSDVFGVEFAEDGLSSNQWAEAEDLAEKYSSNEWNERRPWEAKAAFSATAPG
jgi:lipoate-protein ligase A